MQIRIYFCPECGAYSMGESSTCEECQSDIPEDSWAEVSEEELRQLEYAEEFDYPTGMPSWEYEVLKIKADDEVSGLIYTTELLNLMGEKGWELVDIVSIGDKEDSRYGIFKRSWEAAYDFFDTEFFDFEDDDEEE